MNRLIIIGNGFDLAHGLKTSYADFLQWYLENLLKKIDTDAEVTNPLGTFQRNQNVYPGDLGELLGNLHKKENQLRYLRSILKERVKYSSSSDLFESIIAQLEFNRWVDIEAEYYEHLKRALKKRLKASNATQIAQANKEIAKSNDALMHLRDQLCAYLIEVERKSTLSISSENNYLKHFLHKVEEPYQSSHSPQAFVIHRTVVLNFNYTNTVKRYLEHLNEATFQEIQIHGSINDRESMIFGYGDEIDKSYQEIEDLNDNQWLEHIKSFGYFQNKDYKSLFQFIDGPEKLEIYVMGHSMGISDRTLFSQIFKRTNIFFIRLFHFTDPKTGKSDYREKTYEISRHFNSSQKGEMRLKVHHFDPHYEMIQIQ